MNSEDGPPTVFARGNVGRSGDGAAEASNDSRVPWFEGSVDEWEEARKEAPLPPPSSPSAGPAAASRPSRERLRDEGEIARGGMGSIRQVYDADLLRYVAMKVLDPELAARSGSAERFLDEARITGRLDHPNIVPVHDLIFDAQGLPRYTMKLVDGVTLNRLIATQKSQRDLEKLLEVLIRVCEALSFAHSRGVIHRDLKPDNVMVGSHGQVYLMDWGCAHLMGKNRSLVDGRVDPEGTVIGTVQYMAPEQAWGRISEIDPRTDVFAVGAILYKVLTGTPPYPGPFEEALHLAQQAKIRQPDESSGVAVKPPPNLSRIAMKAMERDPAQRYQSADELAEDLRAFLRGGNWFPLVKFAAGAVIVREGDRADAAYIITAGHCEVRKRDERDPSRSAVLRTLKAGDVFGETAIFADAPRSASVIALDEVSAVVVQRRALDEMVSNSWLGLFVKALADRFLDIDSRLAQARQAIEGPAR